MCYSEKKDCLRLFFWFCFFRGGVVFWLLLFAVVYRLIFQGSTSIVAHLCYLCLVFVNFGVCLLLPCGNLRGKG